MRLDHTSHAEDQTLTAAEAEGGIAGQAADIAARLDAELTEQTKELEQAAEEYASQAEKLDEIKRQHRVMLEALTNLENDDGAIPPSAWEMVQTAIADAGGTPKGAPATDIRAEVAALRQSLAWAINTFQGESGLGDNYWEQFPEYVTACALVADANTQPKEEAP